MIAANCGSIPNCRTLYATLTPSAGFRLAAAIQSHTISTTCRPYSIEDRLELRGAAGDAFKQRQRFVEGGFLRIGELAGVMDAAAPQHLRDKHADIVADIVDMSERVGPAVVCTAHA